MATKTKPMAVSNPLSKLILDHLEKADGHPLPESTIRTSLRDMVVPPADDEDFENSFLLLIQREVATFTEDHVSKERKFFLTARGRSYLAENRRPQSDE